MRLCSVIGSVIGRNRFSSVRCVRHAAGISAAGVRPSRPRTDGRRRDRHSRTALRFVQAGPSRCADGGGGTREDGRSRVRIAPAMRPARRRRSVWSRTRGGGPLATPFDGRAATACSGSGSGRAEPVGNASRPRATDRETAVRTGGAAAPPGTANNGNGRQTEAHVPGKYVGFGLALRHVGATRRQRFSYSA